MNHIVPSPLDQFNTSYQGHKHMHWEGRLPFKEFFMLYWNIVWTKSGWFGKTFFLIFISWLFIPSILFQFVFKKTYCFFVDLKTKKALKKDSTTGKKML